MSKSRSLRPVSDPRDRRDRTESALRRDVGLVAGTLVGVNAMIGTGIFKKSAPIARLVGSLEVTMLVWVAGGVIALAGALSLGELAAAMPRTGGLYEYIRRAFGPTPAFMLGFTRLVLLIPSALGGFAKLAGEAFVTLLGLPASDSNIDAVAITVVVVCAVANLTGVRTSALQQGIVTSIKYVGVLALGVLGLTLVAEPVSFTGWPAPPDPIATSLSATGVFAALVAVMWAYDGWSDLSSLAGEVREPARNLPRAFVLGTLATMLVYLAVNAAYARVLGFEGVARSTVGEHMVAANLATATLGPLGLRTLAALVFLSCLGASMSTLLTGPRVLVAMAADRPPTDIRVDEVNRPIQLWQEAKFALVRLYEGRGLVGERYVLTNVSTQDMVLAEQEFDRERGGVLAVSIENHNLRPGESTSVYVIRQGS